MPSIVERAHSAGLRVSTHVETAADFYYAVLAGVDEINHMPGFRPEQRAGATINPSIYRIDEESARRAGERGISVVTTLGSVLNHLVNAEGQEKALAASYLEVLRENVTKLRRHGVPIAIGSDNYWETSLYEARALHMTGWFDNLALLKAWSETTPATIFPDRRISKLGPGYEASFLVLQGDPIADFANVEKIFLRVKQGVLLN